MLATDHLQLLRIIVEFVCRFCGLRFHSTQEKVIIFSTICSAIDFDCFQLNMNNEKPPNIGVAFKFGHKSISIRSGQKDRDDREIKNYGVTIEKLW